MQDLTHEFTDIVLDEEKPRQSALSTTLRERVLSVRLEDDGESDGDLQRTLLKRDISGLMKAGITMITSRQAIGTSGLTREQFMHLSKEELGSVYDAQQEIDAHMLQVLNYGLELCQVKVAVEDEQELIGSTTVESEIKMSRIELPSLVASSSLFRSQPCSLSHAQLEALTDLTKIDTLEGIFLLVDDSVSVLKILLNHLTSIIYPDIEHRPQHLAKHFNRATKGHWQEIGIVVETRGNWGIVCVANGRYASDVVKHCPIVVTITDQEMPEMTGIDLIKAIRKLELAQTRTPMSIALSTTLSAIEILDLFSVSAFSNEMVDETIIEDRTRSTRELPPLHRLKASYLHKPVRTENLEVFLRDTVFYKEVQTKHSHANVDLIYVKSHVPQLIPKNSQLK